MRAFINSDIDFEIDNGYVKYFKKYFLVVSGEVERCKAMFSSNRPEGKRPLGRPRRRWEDKIKMDLREVGYDGRDWIKLAQDRDRWRVYVRAAMNLSGSLKAILSHFLQVLVLSESGMDIAVTSVKLSTLSHVTHPLLVLPTDAVPMTFVFNVIEDPLF
ncbi:hypothetical protein ANN_06470 [Periplaneta americana]|uniref:Uncharacterized protein n=1 Tax=Periplaneta americana TaxID=6978 RepID=A0ABQ8TDL6_PERAM|nr:hypothetical protein ANN_06470 [Periplaneta americana]